MANFPENTTEIFAPYVRGDSLWRGGDGAAYGHLVSSYPETAHAILERLDLSLAKRMQGEEITFITSRGRDFSSIPIPSLSDCIVRKMQNGYTDIFLASYQAVLEVMATFVAKNPEITTVLEGIFSGAQGWEGVAMAIDISIPLSIIEVMKKDKIHTIRPSFVGRRENGDRGVCAIRATASAIIDEVQLAIHTLSINTLPPRLALGVSPKQMVQEFQTLRA